jgi:hypothetical protein
MMVHPDDRDKEVANHVADCGGHRGINAANAGWAGGFNSSTKIVMIAEKTLSEKELNRSIVAFQWAIRLSA